MERKKGLRKESLIFFFGRRRVYHLIAGSNLSGDILSRVSYEIHLQNRGFSGLQRECTRLLRLPQLHGAVSLGGGYLGKQNWVTKIMSMKANKAGWLGF